MYLKFICRLWLQLWHFFLDVTKKTEIKKTVIAIKRLAKSLRHLVFVFLFPDEYNFVTEKTQLLHQLQYYNLLLLAKMNTIKRLPVTGIISQRTPWVLLSFFSNHLFDVAKWNLPKLNSRQVWPAVFLISDLQGPPIKLHRSGVHESFYSHSLEVRSLHFCVIADRR